MSDLFSVCYIQSITKLTFIHVIVLVHGTHYAFAIRHSALSEAWGVSAS